MVDLKMVADVNEVRKQYLLVIQRLIKVQSFNALLKGSEELNAKWMECRRVADSSRVQNPASASFSCAFVGSSGHGKTTILAEMFPDLERRGLFRTDVTDTTSQALTVRHAASNTPESSRVVVRSWGIDEIRRLVDAAKAENAAAGVVVRYHDDRIEIDGNDANFREEDKRSFKFALNQELRPLPSEWVLEAKQATDPSFINALTTKEVSERIPRGALLTVGGRAFEPLPLRAVIKEVELRDSFSRICMWAKERANEARELIFIDTPGLNVDGTAKDEVLRYVLSKKNQQIVIELIRNDELDVIVHLVLNGQSSKFLQLWRAVADQCSPTELADIEDRLVLAINGVNLYFTNDDLSRKWQNAEAARIEGDHFAVSIEDNILNKMLDRGHCRPSKVCFLDSSRIVKNYAADYAKYKAHLQAWCAPGSVGHETLKRLGLVEALQQNINALCDPGDRGQGHLVRQILDLLREKGAKLFARKYLIRNKLYSSMQTLLRCLLDYYNDTGVLNAQSVRDARKRFFAGIDERDHASMERFARDILDPCVDRVIPALDSPVPRDSWVGACFNQFAEQFRQILVNRASAIPRETHYLFTTFFQKRVNQWHRDWGYASARFPPPTRREPLSAELVRHTLKVHAREMVYQLISEQSVTVSDVPQQPQDRDEIAQTIKLLSQMEQQAGRICKAAGEPAP